MEFLRFATDAIDRRQRAWQWQRVTGCAAVSLADDCEASIRGCELGDIRLCGVTIGAHRLEEDGAGRHINCSGFVKFYFQEEGLCTIEQGGRTIALSPGHWCAIDKDRAYSVDAPASSRQIALVVPRSRIAGWSSCEDLPGVRCFLLGGDHLLHAGVETALIDSAMLGQRDRTKLGDVLVHLLGFALQADRAEAGGSTARHRRLSVVEYIEMNLVDPMLDVGRIADAMRLSKRTLHKLFADDETSLARLIWRRRLDRCRAVLVDPAASRRSITEIAHEWGFSDSQHFSRVFKARFGVPPREFRNRHRLH